MRAFNLKRRDFNRFTLFDRVVKKCAVSASDKQTAVVNIVYDISIGASFTKAQWIRPVLQLNAFQQSQIIQRSWMTQLSAAKRSRLPIGRMPTNSNQKRQNSQKRLAN